MFLRVFALLFVICCFACVSLGDVVLQGKEVTQDASMYSAREARSKHYEGLTVSRGNVYYRSLIRFDLWGLPSKKVKDVAIMLFHRRRYYDNPIRIQAYVVNESWVEKCVSWINRSQGKEWGTNAFGKRIVASFDISKDYGKGWIVLRSKRLTKLVNDWVSGEKQNHGLMLQAGFKFSGPTMRFFTSSDDRNRKRHPKLIVSYDGTIDLSRYGYISDEEMERARKKEEVSRELFFEQAEKAQYANKIFVWKIGPWEKLARYQLPKLTQRESFELRCRMLGDEYYVLSFAITNLSRKKKDVKIGIKGANEFSDAIRIRASYWVKSRPLSDLRGENLPVWVDDALPLIGRNGRLTFLEGQTRRIWLTINSGKMEAGNYQFEIEISRLDGRKLQVVPVRIEVLPLKLKRDSKLRVFTYAYLTRRSTSKYYELAVRDLKEHYQNTYVVNYYPSPKVDVDKAGNVIVRCDFSGMEDWLEQIKDARNVLFYWCWDCGASRPTFGGRLKWLSSEWKRALSLWMKDWYRYLHDKGFDYERVIMYPFDETYDNKILGRTEYQALGEIGEELHKIDSRIRVFADPVSFRKEDLPMYKRLADKVDVWSVNVSLLEKGDYEGWPHSFAEDEKKTLLEFFMRERDKGKCVWAYQCSGPMKGLDVNGYYRRFAWLCWYNGITGMGIWSYNDVRGKSSWDDYDSKSGGDYAMIYELRDAPKEIRRTGEILIPSRRWEMWRIGIQDYYLLQQIRQLFPEKQVELKEIAKDVIDKAANPKSYQVARRKLLKMLDVWEKQNEK